MKSATELAQEGRVGEAFDLVLGVAGKAASLASRAQVWLDHCKMLVKETDRPDQFYQLLDGNLGMLARMLEEAGDRKMGAALRKAQSVAEQQSSKPPEWKKASDGSTEGDKSAAELAEEGRVSEAFDLVLAGKTAGNLREAESAFDKELKPYLMEMIHAAWKKVGHLMDEIDTDNWPDERLKYSVMRYKPLSHTEEQFTQAIVSAYIKWVSKARPR